MATVTSLTATRILELAAGWEGVSGSVEQLNSIVVTLNADQQANQDALNELNTTTLPELYGNLASNQIALDDLNENVLPQLAAEQVSLAADLQDLNTVTIPALNTELDSNSANIADLNDNVLPDLQAQLDANAAAIADVVAFDPSSIQGQLDANTAAINTLNTTTLPGLQSDLDANTSSISLLTTTTIPGIQTDLDAAEASITTLTGTTIPGLQSDIDTNEASIALLTGTTIPNLQSAINANSASINTLNNTTIPALQTTLNNNTSAINTLNNTTIPGLQTSINNNTTSINTLNNTTLPGLTTRVGTAETNVTALQGKFPITGPDIAANAVTANKIAANTITATQIAAHTITATEIFARTITAAEIATDTITANEIAANAITTNELNANAVTAAKIAANTITAAQIAANTITAAQIAANTITATQIAANTITAAQIAADTITAAQIATDAITANELAANAVTAVKINALAVTAGKIAADAVTATEIAANAVTTTELAANAVTAAKIAANTITANEIAALTITGAQIAANTITAGKIAADTITANEIASNAITVNELAANAVTTAKIAAGAVTAITIGAGAITTEKLAVASLGEDLLLNGNFEATSTVDTTIPANWSKWDVNGTHIYSITTTASSGSQAVSIQRNASTGGWAAIASGLIPVTAGDTYYSSVRRRQSGGNAEHIFRIFGYTSAGVESRIVDDWNLVTVTAYELKEEVFTVPAGIVNIRVAHYMEASSSVASAALLLDEAKLSRQIVSAVIADGVINSNKIVTAGLDAGVIKFGTMSGDRILANTIQSSQIVTAGLDAGVIKFGTMSGDRILANTIQSSQIVTAGLDAAVIKFGTMSGDRITVNTINSNHIVTAGLDAQVIKFGTMSGDRITANTLNSDRIVTNSITALQIAANSITASRLVISDYTNLLRDPTFRNTGAWVFTGSSGQWSWGSVSVPNTTLSPEGTALKFTSTGNAYSELQEKLIPVVPGDQYTAMVTLVRSSVTADAAGTFYLRYSWYSDSAGTGLISNTDVTKVGSSFAQNTYYTLTNAAQVPAGAAFLRLTLIPYQTTAAVVYELVSSQLYRKVTSTVLEPNLVLSTRIIAGAAATGARVELNSVGLQAFNAGGGLTAQIAASTGNVSITGEFGTGDPAGAGVRISSNTFAGMYGYATYPTIIFNNGSQAVAGNRQPQIYTDTTGNSNLYIWGGAGSTTRMGMVKLDAGRARIGIENSVGSNEIDGSRIDISFGAMTIAATIISVVGEIQSSGAIQMNGSLQTGASGFQFTNAGGSAWKEINTGVINANGAVNATGAVHAASGGLWMDDLNGGGATTAGIGNGGRVTRATNGSYTTSSIKLKKDVEDMTMSEARSVLNLRSRTYLSRHEEDKGAGRLPGFIAHEAHDAKVHMWVGYRNHDQNDEALGFRYDKVPVAHNMLIRELYEMVEALQREVSALKN